MSESDMEERTLNPCVLLAAESIASAILKIAAIYDGERTAQSSSEISALKVVRKTKDENNG